MKSAPLKSRHFDLCTGARRPTARQLRPLRAARVTLAAVVLVLAPVAIRGLHARVHTGVAFAAQTAALAHAARSAYPQVVSTGAIVSPTRTLAANRVRAEFMNLPLVFEANHRPAGAGVNFVARGPGYEVLLSPGGARLEIPYSEANRANSRTGSAPSRASRAGLAPKRLGSSQPGWTELRLRLPGANAKATASGQDELRAKTNYFIGNDPDHWRTSVPNFGKVRYLGVYPGIDLVYYGNQRQLEYDFVVAPGADPGNIRLAITGRNLLTRRIGRPDAVPLYVDHSGNLVTRMQGGQIAFSRPVAYQLGANGRKDYVAAAYILNARAAIVGRRDSRRDRPESKARSRKSQLPVRGSQIGFKLGDYDRSRTLIIDPSLAYSTYLGGSAGDAATAITIDGSGDAYVVGATNSTNFPVSSSPYQKASGGGSDAFVAEFDPTAAKLLFSTYLGGSGFDKANGVAVDSSGNIYVTGYTASPNFPTTKGVLQTKYGGNGNAFVAKLASGGSSLTYSTYLGGSGGDFGLGISIDPSGDAYITGSTKSADFPVAQAFQNAIAGGADAFVAEVKPDGSALVFSSYLGGSGADSGQGIALDGADNIYVTGITYSSNFPTASPLQAANAGGSDAFVTKIRPSGAGIAYSTYLGGSANDRAYAIAVDASGAVYVAGDTFSTNFPTTPAPGPPPFQAASGGADDAFVAKISPAGNSLIYSSYLGGSGAEQAFGIAIDRVGDAYLTGYTLSSNFPLANALDAVFGGGTCNAGACADAFVTEVNPQGSALLYSTYLGGSGADFGQAIVVDGGGNAYVAGSTASTNFPAIGGAYQSALAGAAGVGNAFASKVSPANAPALSISPQTINFGNQGVNFASLPTVVTLANEGTQPLDISGIAASAQFGQTNNCPPSLAAGGASCTVNVTFTPTATAAANGTLTVTDNAPGSPQTVSLSGTGVTAAPAVTFSPTTLTFGSQTVGTTSPPQAVTVTNTGSADLSISKVAVSGAFAETNNCVTTLKPNASCQASVTFSPTETTTSGSTNTNVGALSVTDNAKGSPQTVSVSGTAVANFSLTATKTNVQVPEGTTSTTFTVSLVVPAGFTSKVTLACQSGATCSYNPASISAGQTSTLTVSGLSGATPNPFDFTATGANGKVTAVLSLAISFEDFSLSGSPPLQTIQAGQSATYTVTLTPTNGFSQQVTLNCPSPINKSTCTFSPPSLTPNGSTPLTATLTVTTTAPTPTAFLWIGRRTLPPWPGSGRHVLVWALAALLLILVAGLGAASRRVRWQWLILGLVVLATLSAASCNLYNYGFVGGSPVPNGTAPGVYTLQISGSTKPASSSSKTAVTRTTTVNLGVS